MKKNLNFILIFSCFILIFSSCGKNVSDEIVASGNRIMMKSAPKMTATNSSAVYADATVEESWSGKGFAPEGPVNQSGISNGENGTSVERKLIKRGNVNIEVQNLKNAEDSVEKWC